MKEIKTKKIILNVYDDEYVSIEVYFNKTWWYREEQFIVDDYLELLNNYLNGEITLLEFLSDFFYDVKFEDEGEEQEAHEFSLEEWQEILEA